MFSNTDFLWSWRLAPGRLPSDTSRSFPSRFPYLKETDDEIEALESHIHELERWHKEQPFQFWNEERWKFEMGLTRKKTPKGRIDKEALAARLDIRDVISSYMKLTKLSDGRYRGLCPFHNEHTPSFTVNVDKQFAYCFGCCVSADVFKFVMLIENCSFIEAMKLLNEKYP